MNVSSVTNLHKYLSVLCLQQTKHVTALYLVTENVFGGKIEILVSNLLVNLNICLPKWINTLFSPLCFGTISLYKYKSLYCWDNSCCLRRLWFVIQILNKVTCVFYLQVNRENHQVNPSLDHFVPLYNHMYMFLCLDWSDYEHW